MIPSDEKVTLAVLKTKMQNFVDERDWQQFHTPKNLASAIAVEAGELLEQFIWLTGEKSFAEFATNRQDIEDEFADIFMLLLHFANAANIDINSAIESKLKKVVAKYPVDKAKGVATKYNKL
jgi:dCTP diphosphatase